MQTSIEPSTSFTTSDGSYEVDIDALESIFEVQKLKTNFVFGSPTQSCFWKGIINCAWNTNSELPDVKVHKGS